MWQRYWRKEIIFLVVFLFNSRIDFTEARVSRNDIKMVATDIAGPAHMFRRDKNSNLPPDNMKSSELVRPGDTDKRNHTAETDKSKWQQIWSNVVEYVKPAEVEPKHPTTDEQIMTVCFAIATTYMGALRDLRRFFSLRYFYANNFHYEVGYMISEIISKYQRMLEIYYIAQTYYFEHQDKNLAPPSYMLYLYTNVLEMGTVIAHQCNMLEELEDKFRTVPDSGFGDYHLDKKSKTDNGTGEYEKAIAHYQKRLIAEQKKRERERRKLRKKNLFAEYQPTTPQRKPRKGQHFPLVYGWSIEFF